MKQFKFGFGDDEQMEVTHIPVKNISENGNEESTDKEHDGPENDTSAAPKALSFPHDYSEYSISSIATSSIAQEEILKNEFYVPVYDEELGDTFDESKSDLIPGKYEGGKRVWEASRDLARYAYDCIAHDASHPWLQNNKIKILELGCGHAIPSSVFVFYMLDRVERLDLQDYNEDVLRNITARNVCLWDDAMQEVDQSLKDTMQITYWSGDWGDLLEMMPEHEYDLIMAAETLYSQESFEKQWRLMKHCLKPDGRIWIAAKRYYYGVGGGTFAFSEMIQNEANVESVLEIANGLSNVREILEVTMKK